MEHLRGCPGEAGSRVHPLHGERDAGARHVTMCVQGVGRQSTGQAETSRAVFGHRQTVRGQARRHLEQHRGRRVFRSRPVATHRQSQRARRSARPEAGHGAAVARPHGEPNGTIANVTNERNFDFLVPEVKLRIDGNALSFDASSDIVSVHVLEDVNAAGMFTFTLLSWDGNEMRVTWIDDNQFKEGNTVEIDMGYRDNMKTLFSGEI